MTADRSPVSGEPPDPHTEPRTDYDRRALTEDQRYIAEDLASSMPDGHEEQCGVWNEAGDGCTCPLVLSIADGLAGMRVVALDVERGYDSATHRGERVVRLPFRPMPAEATPRADAPPLRAALIGLLNALNVYERNWLTSTTGYGKVAEAAKQARTALSAPATPAESVAVAWAEAEAALPDDWELSLSFGTFGSRTGYHALAEYAHSLRYYRQHVGPSRSIPSVSGDGPTPEAALRVLAARLRAEQEGEDRA